jgi:steroid 5-alpha reductase family enzyme
MPIGPKLAIWISCALLYTLETIPVYFRLQNNAPADAMLYIGLAVMLCGLSLETCADLQKSAAKKKAPYAFVSTGLFSFVRCPNYLGELVFWLGVLLQGSTALEGAGQWLPALLGYALLIYIMFSGARRLEIRQNKNYGSDPEYRRYVKRVPILLPFIPLYSVEKYKWLVA